MKKIYVIFIAVMLMFTGCKSSLDKETENISDMSANAATENSENKSEKISPENNILSESSEWEDFPKKTTNQVKSENSVSNYAFSNSVADNELPIINDEIQEIKAKVTTSVKEKSEIQTTASDNSSETTTCMKDDVIELPFVPAM